MPPPLLPLCGKHRPVGRGCSQPPGTGRYQRFYNLQARAEFLSYDKERLNVPKGHQVLHMIAFMLLYGPVDLARLNICEALHVQYVKDAIKRTRQHMYTCMREMHKPVSHMETMHAAKAYERGPHPRHACSCWC